MFQLSLFTEFGRLCNPFDYVLGFTFLLMAFHLLFLLFNLRERQRVKLFCLGSASLVLLLHIAALRLSFQFTNLTFDAGDAGQPYLAVSTLPLPASAASGVRPAQARQFPGQLRFPQGGGRMIDAPFCNAVSLLTGFTGWVLAVWSFLRPERDRSGWKLAGGGMACALALLAQLFAVQLETVAGDLETALVQASGAAIAGRILFVITLIFETMAVVSHHFAARDRT